MFIRRIHQQCLLRVSRPGGGNFVRTPVCLCILFHCRGSGVSEQTAACASGRPESRKGRGMIIDSSTTFGELRNMLPSTGNRRVPGVKQLRGKADLLLKKDTASGTIEIFDNGFFIFEECGKSTVYGVDRCASMKTYDSYAKSEMTDELDPYPWDLILESAASARLGHNFESREQNQSEISIDAEESQNNSALSVRPEHEIREEEEEQTLRRSSRNQAIAKEYASLREDQKEMIDLYFVKRMRQEDIAKLLGITQSRVSRRITTIEKRLKKFL